ncbi:MAG TPA: rod shape-determining protein RodA [Kouleothrix sp.]|uniref:rod shape-determining protein RodA n=1 Tax=Kouleothrix sp. TaxID=2779161 RepID=UPI002B8A38C8|nr:rod shape-determining protein RodA [Kouleothrix sp.]HRC76314.1 rod shape-determining protein RodA [Kouleothrix sp.]
MSRTWRDYNYFLLGCVIVLTGFSLALIYTTTLNSPGTRGYFARHLVNLIVGAVAMTLLTALDYHALLAWSRPMYIGTVAILGVVMVLGHVRGGAQSWLDLGLRTFQPSEPAKLAIILTLAAYWERFAKDGGAWRMQVGGLLLAGIPMAMVFIQPDFGTTLVIATIWFMIAWAAGMRWWQIALLLVAALPIGYYGWTEVLKEYQKTRILIFLDPIRYDPKLENGAWNIIQALNAIGSGGLTGQGWTHGPLTQGNYIPVQYSDFIFAAAGEELGFIGTTILVLFEALLIWQALAVAKIARDTFGRLIAVGVAAMFMCHLLVNAGMNMSIMPITGIPLPFISYGGSFNMTALAAVGLLQSVALHRRRIMF